MHSSGVGKAPTGSSVPMPERPNSAMRGAPGLLGGGGGPPGTAAGRPPGTAMRGPGGGGSVLGAVGNPPPGTAFKRLGTAQGGRPGTGQQGAAGARTGTNPQVDNRPITNHGVSGITKTAVAGGRKVLDKNYFVSELRQKRSEVATVTQRMRVGQTWAHGDVLQFTATAGLHRSLRVCRPSHP